MKGKNTSFIASVVYLILGLVLLFFPSLTADLLCTVVGVLFLVYGIITVVSFFAHRGSGESFSFQAELILGVVAILVGVFFLTHSSFIVSIIPIIMGLYILIDGLVNLKRGMDLRSMGYAGWTRTLVTSVISLVLGIVILWNPFKTGLILWRIIGVAFLYQGVSDLLAIHNLNKAAKGS